MRAVLTAALLLAFPQQGWDLLGARRVSFTLDHDAILVGARAGAYTAVKIEVAGGNLEMYNILVTFGNGDTWSPNTRVQFREGSWSRTIDLPGPVRAIRRVDFWYRSRLRRGGATVRVFGRGTDAPAPQPATVAEARAALTTAPASTAGWEHLGARPVDFRVDHDAVLAGGQGAFRAVRFDVEGGNIEMFDVKITFGNGESFSPATRFLFSGGTTSRVIDLPGNARIVRRIDFFYRTVGGLLTTPGPANATVHVYGRR
ncbi:MAG: hypothetical protein ABR537_01310 [Gemmatimonadales bacterium]